MQQLKAAEDDLLHVLTLEFTRTDVYINIGKMYQDANDNERALRFYRLAENAGEKHADFFVNYTALLLEMKNAQAAVEVARKGLGLHPKDDRIRNNYASALDDIGQPRQAIAELEKILVHQPRDPETHYNIVFTGSHCTTTVTPRSISSRRDSWIQSWKTPSPI